MEFVVNWIECSAQFLSHLCAKCEIVSKIWNIIFRQEYQTLVERIVFTFHVCVPVKTETLPINIHSSYQNLKKPRKLSYKVAFLFTQPWWLLNYEQFKIQSIHEQCTTFCWKKGTLTWQSGLWYVCRMTEWSSTPEACYRTQPWRWCDPRTCSSWGGCCCSERTGWLCRWPCLLVMYWTEHTWGWRFPWIWWCTTLLASLQHLDPLHLLIQITINIK